LATITPLIQRQNEEPEEEEEELIQAKGAPSGIAHVNTELPSSLNSLISRGGRPLPASERAFFEPRFNHDFSSVHVFDDSQAAGLAQGINARAFTYGNNVVFGSTQYTPESSDGRRLMAHELTHVVQQGGWNKRYIQPKYIEEINDRLPKRKFFTPNEIDEILENEKDDSIIPKKDDFLRPHAGEATIKCKSGKYVVDLGAWAGTSCDQPKCVTVHEKSHIKDWKKRWPKGCKKSDGTNQPDGYLPTGGPGYNTFLNKSECRAHKADIACANKQQAKAKGGCKNVWKNYIVETTKYKDKFCK